MVARATADDEDEGDLSDSSSLSSVSTTSSRSTTSNRNSRNQRNLSVAAKTTKLLDKENTIMLSNVQLEVVIESPLARDKKESVSSSSSSESYGSRKSSLSALLTSKKKDITKQKQEAKLQAHTPAASKKTSSRLRSVKSEPRPTRLKVLPENTTKKTPSVNTTSKSKTPSANTSKKTLVKPTLISVYKSDDVFEFTGEENDDNVPLSYVTKSGRKSAIPSRRSVRIASDVDCEDANKRDSDFHEDNDSSSEESSPDEAPEQQSNSEESADSDSPLSAVKTKPSRRKTPRQRICMPPSSASKSRRSAKKTPSTSSKRLSQSTQVKTPGICERLLPRLEASDPLEFARQRYGFFVCSFIGWKSKV